MSHIDVMKQALEYLQDNQHLIADNERHAYVMEYNAFIERFEQAIADAEKQQALDKMADNARELGLSYEPAQQQEARIAQLEIELMKKQGRELKLQFAPAQQDIPDLIAGALGVSRGTAYDMMREALAEQPAPAQPMTQDMVESCPYYAETLRGAYFDGWLKAEAAHGITKGGAA